MGNYTIFEGFENPRRVRQARNLTTKLNVPKILDLKSSSEQIFPKIVVGCPCSITFRRKVYSDITVAEQTRRIITIMLIHSGHS